MTTPGTGAIHVLLVEDHAMLRGILEQTLKGAGFRVTSAVTGDEAAALLADGSTPDVLLSDIRMRGRLNGIDLAREARRQHPSMAIVLQTAFGQAGASEFLTLRKPFYPQSLLETIQQALQQSSALPAT